MSAALAWNAAPDRESSPTEKKPTKKTTTRHPHRDKYGFVQWLRRIWRGEGRKKANLLLSPTKSIHRRELKKKNREGELENFIRGNRGSRRRKTKRAKGKQKKPHLRSTHKELAQRTIKRIPIITTSPARVIHSAKRTQTWKEQTV